VQPRFLRFSFSTNDELVATAQAAIDEVSSRLMKNSLRGEGDSDGPDAQTYEAGRRGAAVFAEYGEPRRL
jgi:hypothetical protein